MGPAASEGAVDSLDLVVSLGRFRFEMLWRWARGSCQAWNRQADPTSHKTRSAMTPLGANYAAARRNTVSAFRGADLGVGPDGNDCQ